MAVVTLDNLTKIYHSAHPPAAQDVSLEIGHGEFMVLLGPSGCGKTTTLRMIAGLESISSGTLSIDGATVNDVPAKDRDIAMVFQSYALYPHMNVRNNLSFGLKRRRVPKDEIQRKVSEVADILELTPLLDRKPHALSGGQRQRVALGRAIVRDPKVFLFDEPLSNLDAALRASTRTEISDLHKRLDATMIYVTHDQVEAMTMGTRICIMNGGKVMQIGRPLDVYRAPVNTFVAGFLGNPPMNLVQTKMVDGSEGRTLELGGQNITIPQHRMMPQTPGRQVRFGVRPEDIRLNASSKEDTVPVEVNVVGLEPLGAETIIMARTIGKNENLIARVPGDAKVAVHDRCIFHIRLDRMHVFDSNGASVSAKLIRENGNE